MTNKNINRYHAKSIWELVVRCGGGGLPSSPGVGKAQQARLDTNNGDKRDEHTIESQTRDKIGIEVKSEGHGRYLG